MDNAGSLAGLTGNVQQTAQPYENQDHIVTKIYNICVF